MISIIVPCKNRIKKLQLCLDSIMASIVYAKQNKLNEDFEIIVVNDHSDEGFNEEVNSLFPNVKIVDSDGAGPGYARNLGIRNSNGEYIFFTDSDCVVSQNWILNGYRSIIESGFIVIQGNPWLFQKNENPYFGLQEEKLYEIMFSTYLYDNKLTRMTDSRNLLLKRDIVKFLGNEVFSEKTNKATAESRVFGKRCNAKGIKILFDKSVEIYHEDSLDMLSVCNQKYRHGSGRVEIWETIPEYDYLRNRYFDNPIKNGIDIDYVLPSHFSFLLGYFHTLNNKNEYDKFISFANEVFNKYGKSIANYDYLSEIMNKKIW